MNILLCLTHRLTKTRVYRLTNTALSSEAPDQEILSQLLQQQEEVRGNRVRYIAGILIMIGLLGTFLGTGSGGQISPAFFHGCREY